jgi:hypothetical protein
MARYLMFLTGGRTESEGVQKQVAKENILTCGRGSGIKLKKTT